MRTINFRGKRKDSTGWLVGDLNHIEGAVFIFPRSEDTPLNSPDWFEVIAETVGQYTELKDDKENELYEGDLISFGAQLGSNSPIQYRNGGFFAKDRWGDWKWLFDIVTSTTCIKTGNIHDNKELLKTNKLTMKEPILKLTESHPTHKKVIQLHELAESLGLSFYFGTECVIVHDGDVSYKIEDIEGAKICSFPFQSEFKITIQ